MNATGFARRLEPDQAYRGTAGQQTKEKAVCAAGQQSGCSALKRWSFDATSSRHTHTHMPVGRCAHRAFALRRTLLRACAPAVGSAYAHGALPLRLQRCACGPGGRRGSVRALERGRHHKRHTSPGAEDTHTALVLEEFQRYECNARPIRRIITQHLAGPQLLLAVIGDGPGRLRRAMCPCAREQEVLGCGHMAAMSATLSADFGLFASSPVAGGRSRR